MLHSIFGLTALKLESKSTRSPSERRVKGFSKDCTSDSCKTGSQMRLPEGARGFHSELRELSRLQPHVDSCHPVDLYRWLTAAVRSMEGVWWTAAQLPFHEMDSRSTVASATSSFHHQQAWAERAGQYLQLRPQSAQAAFVTQIGILSPLVHRLFVIVGSQRQILWNHSALLEIACVVVLTVLIPSIGRLLHQ